MIQLINMFCVLFGTSNIWLLVDITSISDYNKWLILLFLIQLSGGRCILLMFSPPKINLTVWGIKHIYTYTFLLFSVQPFPSVNKLFVLISNNKNSTLPLSILHTLTKTKWRRKNAWNAKKHHEMQVQQQQAFLNYHFMSKQ